MKKFSLCLFVLLNMAYSANSYPKDTEKQNFSSQDIHQIKDIHSLDLSPSSNFIIYLSTSTNQKKDHYESTMWLQDRKKNKTQAIVKNSTSIDKPSFSPNENYVSYLAAGKGKYSNYQQLWLINRKNLKKNFEVNVFNSKDLILNAIENNCKKFMIISSSSEFGEININTNGVKRNDFKFPNDSYGLSKLVFNNIAYSFSKKYKCKFRIMRLFPVYGEGENQDRLYSTIKRCSKENKNLFLKNQLEKVKQYSNLDSLKNTNFTFRNAKVISNNLSSFKNHLIINKGVRHGLKNEMGVINSTGIVGIINRTSKNYSSVMSVLNIDTKINAKVKRTSHFGTLEWNGLRTSYLVLNDIPETANIKVGDSIITGGMSLIFPEGINIGVVSEILNQNKISDTVVRFGGNIDEAKYLDFDFKENYLTVKVKLHTDMNNLNNVYVIESLNRKEFQKIKK